ncbi:MAG: hypothetical protein V1751_05730 [Pseudomonadota bacterium]
MGKRSISLVWAGLLPIFTTLFFILSALPIALRAETDASQPSLPAVRKDSPGLVKSRNRSAREEWFRIRRSYPGNHIPAETHRKAVVKESGLSTQSAAGQIRWESIGPGPIDNMTMYGAGDLTTSGRALAIVIHPNDPDLLLLGAAQGGIWRSTNGGRNFTPVADNMPSLAIKVIRFAPSNPHIVYAGSGEPHSKTSIFGMGVYKSTDGGQTWMALPSHGSGWDFRYVAISGLRVDPINPDLVYVTAADILPDRVNLFEPPPTPQTGIFKSTDGGQTWRCTQYAVDYRDYMYPEYDPYRASGVGFMDLELFLANPSVLFATEMSGGIYRSTDSGEHWQRVTPVKNPGGVADAGPDFPAPVPQFSYYDPNTFAFITYNVAPRGKDVPEFNRIEISLAQAGEGITQDYRTTVLYAGVGAVIQLDRNNNGGYDSGTDLQAAVGLLFKSTDGGQTWKWLGDWSQGIPNYCDTYGSVVAGHVFMDCLYDNTVQANPSDANDVLIGGNANYNQYWPDPITNPTRMLEIPWKGMVYRSADGGTTWTDTTPACGQYVLDTSQPPINGLPVYKCIETPSDKIIHPDVHSAFYDTANNRFYVTTDGGLHRCTVSDGGLSGETNYSWTTLNNNLSTLQFFNMGSHPTDPNRILGGMQDNAATFWNGTFWDAWDFSGSDGNVATFDPANPQHVYVGWQYALARNDTGGDNIPGHWKTLFDSSMGQGDTLPFVTIFEIDPVETNIVYVGSETGLYRSSDRGDHWETRLNSFPIDQVTAISVSPKDHNKVWVGTSKGQVYLFDIEKREFSDRTGANFPNRWISSIKASPRHKDTVTVAFSGYDVNSKDQSKGGNGKVGKVLRSTNMGKRWSDISGNLTEKKDLDIPISALVIDPEDEKRMWIGTDTAVYQTVNRGKTWTSYRGNMPAVAITALEYNVNTGYLMAATFGRSIWRTIVPPVR